MPVATGGGGGGATAQLNLHSKQTMLTMNLLTIIDSCQVLPLVNEDATSLIILFKDAIESVTFENKIINRPEQLALDLVPLENEKIKYALKFDTKANVYSIYFRSNDLALVNLILMFAVKKGLPNAIHSQSNSIFSEIRSNLDYDIQDTLEMLPSEYQPVLADPGMITIIDQQGKRIMVKADLMDHAIVHLNTLPYIINFVTINGRNYTCQFNNDKDLYSYLAYMTHFITPTQQDICSSLFNSNAGV